MLFIVKYSIYLLFIYNFYSVAYNITSFTTDKHCKQFAQIEGNLNLEDVDHVSHLQCARICAHQTKCQYFRTFSFNNGTGRCEIFSIKSTASSQSSLPLQSQWQPTQRLSMGPHSQSPRVTCFRPYNSEQNYSAFHGSPKIDTPQYKNNESSKSVMRQIFINSSDPATQTKSHMGSLLLTPMDGKVLYSDELNVIHAFVINTMFLDSNEFKGSMVYSMDQSDGGFLQSAPRVVYSFDYTGTQHVNALDLYGKYSSHKTSILNMFLVTPRVSEYTLIAKNVMDNVLEIVSWVRQGFKVYDYKYASILDGRGLVVFYKLNQAVEFSSGNPKVPLAYRQGLLVFGQKERILVNVLGNAQNISAFRENIVGSVAFSPLWRLAVGNTLNLDEKIATLTSLMLKGHKFRVSYNGSFFDVDDVTKFGKEIYFILPQQIRDSPTTFTGDVNGLRAVASMWGNYFWCSHYLEGEKVLDSGSKINQHFEYFVDKKEWLNKLSVFYDGTILSGSVSDLAMESLRGKDVNVLIEWVDSGKIRLLSIMAVNVYYFETPDVVVTAESFVSWNLISQMANYEKLELSSQCNMEKIFIKSNGQVQILVYNVNTRAEVIPLTDVLITWFVF